MYSIWNYGADYAWAESAECASIFSMSAPSCWRRCDPDERVSLYISGVFVDGTADNIARVCRLYEFCRPIFIGCSRKD